MDDGWMLPEARQREQSVTSDWTFVNQALIHGVAVHEVRSVPTAFGYLTELYRADWPVGGDGVDQIFQSVLAPGAISAWHAHADATDRLFVNHGRMLIALFDNRPESPTTGVTNEFRFGTVRPALVVVPPGVWHGVKNIGWEPGSLINAVDHAYAYEAPDHWSVRPDSPHVPYDIVGASE